MMMSGRVRKDVACLCRNCVGLVLSPLREYEINHTPVLCSLTAHENASAYVKVATEHVRTRHVEPVVFFTHSVCSDQFLSIVDRQWKQIAVVAHSIAITQLNGVMSSLRWLSTATSFVYRASTPAAARVVGVGQFATSTLPVHRLTSASVCRRKTFARKPSPHAGRTR